MNLDQDAARACADLVGRTGAGTFQAGYLHDGVPSAEAGWYAYAQYPGARIMVENHPGPAEACDALARRLLTGAKCTHCGALVALSPAGATAFPGARFVDGSQITREWAEAGQCLWRRAGPRWVASCREGDTG